MQLAYMFEDLETRYTPYVCGALFLMGCAMAHPWYLIGMRIQYNRFHAPISTGVIHREGYQNTFKALIYVKETQGLRGLWRGFLPALFVYGATQYEDLNRMVFSKARHGLKS